MLSWVGVGLGLGLGLGVWLGVGVGSCSPVAVAGACAYSPGLQLTGRTVRACSSQAGRAAHIRLGWADALGLAGAMVGGAWVWSTGPGVWPLLNVVPR